MPLRSPDAKRHLTVGVRQETHSVSEPFGHQNVIGPGVDQPNEPFARALRTKQTHGHDWTE